MRPKEFFVVTYDLPSGGPPRAIPERRILDGLTPAVFAACTGLVLSGSRRVDGIEAGRLIAETGTHEHALVTVDSLLDEIEAAMTATGGPVLHDAWDDRRDRLKAHAEATGQPWPETASPRA